MQLLSLLVRGGLSALGYTAVHRLSDWLLIPSLLRHYYRHPTTTNTTPASPTSMTLQQLPLADRLYLSGKLLSSVNGLLCGGSALYWVIAKPQFQGVRGVMDAYPDGLDTVWSLYIGYTLYDMLHNMLPLGKQEHWTMWLHHCLGILGTSVIMVYRRVAYFPVAVMISELSVLATNWLWLLRTLRIAKQSLHYRVTNHLRTLTFLVFRSFLVPWLLWNAWQQGHAGGTPETSTTTAHSKWEMWQRELARVPWWIVYGSAFNLVFLGTLNLWWTLVMGRGLLLRRSRTTKKDT